MILFSVKDKDLFGITNQFVAECSMTFQEIMLLNGSREQIHLKLSRPNSSGELWWSFAVIPDFQIFFFSIISVIETDCVRALDHRQGDKQAKEFIKKLKQKVTT